MLQSTHKVYIVIRGYHLGSLQPLQYSKEIVLSRFTGATHSISGNSPHKGHCEKLLTCGDQELIKLMKSR